MAPPPIIELENKKNKFRDGIFTQTVDLDSIGDVFADIGAVHKEDFTNLLFQFKNEGANEFDFEFYGTALENIPDTFDDEPKPTPPDFADGVYVPLPNGVGTIPASATDGCTSSDVWNWILIRAKLTLAGQATTGKLYIRGGL